MTQHLAWNRKVHSSFSLQSSYLHFISFDFPNGHPGEDQIVCIKEEEIKSSLVKSLPTWKTIESTEVCMSSDISTWEHAPNHLYPTPQFLPPFTSVAQEHQEREGRAWLTRGPWTWQTPLQSLSSLIDLGHERYGGRIEGRAMNISTENKAPQETEDLWRKERLKWLGQQSIEGTAVKYKGHGWVP